MKKLLPILLGLALIVACQKEMNQNEINDIQDVENTHMEKFAKMLSVSVYNSRPLRDFIRTEAIKQFDNDSDVLYGLVKDKTVDGQYTFRDIIIQNCGDESVLSDIEKRLPLLNIYIPDFTWINNESFCAENWDTSVPEITVLCSESNNLYGDGEIIYKVEDKNIPVSPILIVKNNERMLVKQTTKSSGDFEYEFKADAYDGTKTISTKGVDASYNEMNLPMERCDYFYPASKIHSSVIRAWNEFGGQKDAAERDYVYYGMTKTNKVGVLNSRVREVLLRFRIDPQKYDTICDQEGDPVFSGKTPQYTYTLSEADLMSKIWKDGKFEFEFDVCVGLKSGGVSVQTLSMSVPPGDIFQLSKISYEFWHKTWFSKRKWRYNLDLIKVNSKIENLKSKWYYPNERTMIVPWDLYNESNNVTIHAREIDDDTTVSRTKTTGFKYSNNFSVSLDVDIKKISLGVSDSNNVESTKTETYTVQYKKGCDELGSICLRYIDPIITGKQIKDGITEYSLFSTSSGAIEMCFIPMVY